MKLTRSSLKSLIKECIVEVLEEGLNPEVRSSKSRISENRSRAPRESQKNAPRRRSALDNIKFEKKAEKAAASMTEDPVMQSIFADTVKTTLQDQFASSKSPIPAGADRATIAAASADPINLFEGSQNWATLAFTDGNLPE